jgi:hypothetical protein
MTVEQAKQSEINQLRRNPVRRKFGICQQLERRLRAWSGARQDNYSLEDRQA